MKAARAIRAATSRSNKGSAYHSPSRPLQGSSPSLTSSPQSRLTKSHLVLFRCVYPSSLNTCTSSLDYRASSFRRTSHRLDRSCGGNSGNADRYCFSTFPGTCAHLMAGSLACSQETVSHFCLPVSSTIIFGAAPSEPQYEGTIEAEAKVTTTPGYGMLHRDC